MRKRLAIGAALALVIGAVGAGCGGSDSTSTSTGASGASGATGAQGAPLTKQAFLAKGNAICKKGNQTLNQDSNKYFNSLGLSKGQQPTSAQIADYVNQTAAPNIQAQITAIEALPAPTADEAQVTAITDAAQQALDKVKADPSLLVQNGNSDPFKSVNDLAKKYGLTECAGGN
ncbi:MAG: hypothetical protein ACRDK1_02235 [Solirubrobacterales bacterium]